MRSLKVSGLQHATELDMAMFRPPVRLTVAPSSRRWPVLIAWVRRNPALTNGRNGIAVVAEKVHQLGAAAPEPADSVLPEVLPEDVARAHSQV